LVEALDLAVALWIPGGAEHEADLEAAAGGGGVVGFEPRTAVEKQEVHEAEPTQHAMQAAQEQLRALDGADDDPEPEPGGVVEEEHRHALGAADASAEVLAIGEHHHHAVRIREPALVGFLLRGDAAQRQAQADARAPHRRPIDALIRANHAAHDGPADQLGDRGVAVLGLLRREEVDQRLGQRQRDRPRGPRGLDPAGPLAVELGDPAVDRAHRTGLVLAGDRQVLLRGDLAHGGIHRLARQLAGLHRRDDLVAEQRLG
jgi:hypothetical protein